MKRKSAIRNPQSAMVDVFGDGRAVLHQGDCLAVMSGMPPASVDAIVTDPPYGLVQNKKGGSGAASVNLSAPAGRSRIGTGAGPGGFMGQKWDARVPGPEFWAAALRVAKPGAHLLAFGGTRTFHRLACAIEDAGWEIRDTVMWVYGSGFPKSLDVPKAIDKAAGVDTAANERCREADEGHCRRGPRKPRNPVIGQLAYHSNKLNPDGIRHLYDPCSPQGKRWDGWGTALKPAWEPIIVARKPLEGTVARNVLKHGTGGLNIDGCRVPGIPASGGSQTLRQWRRMEGRTDVPIPPPRGTGRQYRPARVAENHGLGRSTYEGGAAKQGGSRATGLTALGRWPANLIHDGSEEVVSLFPQSDRAGGVRVIHVKATGTGRCRGREKPKQTIDHGDSGSAARFFYCAKASRAEREEGCEGLGNQPQAHNLSSNAYARCGRRVKTNGSGEKCECGELRETVKLPRMGNAHPTVKPVALMRYLCRLVTPPDGVILDPFMGSGSTGKAAILEGFRFIGIDEDARWVDIARRRIRVAVPPLFAQAAPDSRTARTGVRRVRRGAKRQLAAKTSDLAQRSARGERHRPAV